MESNSKRTARPAPSASQIRIQSWLGARRERAFVGPVAETLNRRVLLSPSVPETSWQRERKSKRIMGEPRPKEAVGNGVRTRSPPSRLHTDVAHPSKRESWDRLLDSYHRTRIPEQVFLSLSPLSRAVTAALLLLPACWAGQAPTARPTSAGHAVPAPVSSDNQFDANITLFSTLAAINAAGYDAGINAPIYANIPIRAEIRAELAKRSIPCLAELKDFYRQHKKASEA